MNHQEKKHNQISLAAGSVILLTAIGAWLRHGNTAVDTSSFVLSDRAIPKAFDGFTIAQISDLHSTQFGKDQEKLTKRLTEAKPDIIVVTGDLLDSRRSCDVKIAVDTLRQMIKIAPVYYVTGNHESRIPDLYQGLERQMKDMGVCVLRSESAFLKRKNDKIQIIGMDDPAFYAKKHRQPPKSNMEMLKKLKCLVHKDAYTVLLSHRPDLFDRYCKTGANLIFCGHAHGGQFRIPGIGGVYAPNQGLLPKYTEGCFVRNGAVMFVSRGLGNSLFPFRLNNPPEVVVVTLKRPSKITVYQENK